MKDAPPPFAFIVGRGRSGTTLVRAGLDSHPDAAVVHETHFISQFARARNRYETPDGFATQAFLRDLTAHSSFFRFDMKQEEAAVALVPEPASLAEAVRRIYARYASRRGKARYGDKTPNYVMHIDVLAKLLPEARFVHVIRDGRDSALSYLSSDFGPTSVAEAAVYWRRFVARGRSAGNALGRARYLEVRYEKLVAEPETELRSICTFLSLPFDDAMLRYPERAAELVGKIHHNLARPPTQGLRDWRHDMPREDIVMFEALAGDLLGELGYERTVRRIPPGAKLRAWRAALGVQAGRVARRTGKGSAETIGGAPAGSQEAPR